MIKVLNLYAGIGGNRKLWENVDVTAIEINSEIASIYSDFFPKDNIIVTDAHSYLLENYEKFDFIWSSPPCPTHSDINRAAIQGNKRKPKYPDIKLYEEIIFLMHFGKKRTTWVVENVRPYYEPLIKPQYCGRHVFWANFKIEEQEQKQAEVLDNIDLLQKLKGFDLSNYKLKDKRRILRNCVQSELGKHIFDCAFKIKQERLSEVL